LKKSDSDEYFDDLQTNVEAVLNHVNLPTQFDMSYELPAGKPEEFEMSKADYMMLVDFFKKDVMNLQRLTGKNFPWTDKWQQQISQCEQDDNICTVRVE